MTKPLYIPFHKYQYVGGPASFMRNLKAYLDGVNFNYTESFWGAKAMFFPMGYRPSKLWALKALGLKVIQRLDGVYYPSQHGDRYKRANRLQEIVYSKYADFIVIQSEYSKKQVFEMFGEKELKSYKIIVNGVNKEFFKPYSRKTGKKLRFLVTGVFRKKAMIEPIILALDSLKNEFDFELSIVGPVKLNALKPFLKRGYVNYIGEVNLEEMPDIYNRHDILLHTQINDNCPNIVLEAISCGLPVVGFDSGAMSELCFFSEELLAPVNDEIFQKYEDFDFKKLAEKIRICVDNFSDFKKRALNKSHLYSFDECGRKYVEVFNNILGEL